MTQPARTLVDEVVRLLEINRTTINGLLYGDVIFKVHQGKVVEVIAAQTLKLSAGAQLCPLSLKSEKVS